MVAEAVLAELSTLKKKVYETSSPPSKQRKYKPHTNRKKRAVASRMRLGSGQQINHPIVEIFRKTSTTIKKDKRVTCSLRRQ